MNPRQQQGEPDALFVVFNVDGGPGRTRAYFKNVSDVVIGEFAVSFR